MIAYWHQIASIGINIETGSVLFSEDTHLLPDSI